MKKVFYLIIPPLIPKPSLAFLIALVRNNVCVFCKYAMIENNLQLV